MSCADYQALMPRRGTASGYDQVHVCAFCIEFLDITASSKTRLKTMQLSKLRRYVDAYSIPVKGPIDKNDLVDAIIAARTPAGTLPSANESYYRTNAVPTHRPARSRGFFSNRPPPPTQQRTSAQPSDFPGPDLDPQPASQRHTSSTHSSAYSSTPPPPPPPRFRTASQPQPPPRSPPQFTARPPPAASPPRPARTNARPTAPRSPPQPSTASPPTPILPPPLSALLAMSDSAPSRLPVHTLKQILYDARVHLPADLLEKGELVARNERREREEREQEERERQEREEEEERERIRAAMETEGTHWMRVHDEDVGVDDEPQHRPPPASSSSPSPKPTSTERSGLCVICQDQEANIAIVDCGHLAMCRACSELVLASSRECPLCRTRIVTEARLLRIFKT
ncbi:hypothetical protein M405DRAFT_871765 [Rhizopogon salebrosus TDB-379]|nr:hypothetical protein M405DRAFT_871765 [Rhizopogon salebrosus TDB-379]